MPMSGRRFKVAQVRGIPIYVGTSWLVIAGLYLFATFEQLSRSSLRPTDTEAFMLAVFSFVLFFGGVLVHEGAHAVVARGFDLPVAGITLVFWGGATETRANAKGPLAEFLVSAAGPASTLVLAGAFAFAGGVMDPGLPRLIVRDLAFLNLLFAGWNALPGFPLDGGRMLLAATWGITRSRRIAMQVAAVGGMLVGGGFAVAALMGLSRGDVGRTIFFGYLGFILIATGRAMRDRIGIRERLATGAVAEAMRAAPVAIEADMPLADALDRVLRGSPDDDFPVVAAGEVIGTVSMTSARKVGGRDPLRPVRDGMRPLGQTPVVSPTDPLDDAFDWVASKDALVFEGRRLVGALGPRDIERWYARRWEGASGLGDDEPAGSAAGSAEPATGHGPSPPPRPDV